jgi:hypothetical protein
MFDKKMSDPIQTITLSSCIIDELENPDWKSGGRVHNWKHYVDDEFKKGWKLLTYREKTIIAHFCQNAANNEEWD